MNLLHVAKHASGDQMGPNVQKAMPFGSPLIEDRKIANFLKKNIFLFFDLFLGPTGVIFAVSALPAMLFSWHTS